MAMSRPPDGEPSPGGTADDHVADEIDVAGTKINLGRKSQGIVDHDPTILIADIAAHRRVEIVRGPALDAGSPAGREHLVLIDKPGVHAAGHLVVQFLPLGDHGSGFDIVNEIQFVMIDASVLLVLGPKVLVIQVGVKMVFEKKRHFDPAQ